MTGGFFAILDDIAMLLDDAAMATKISIQKTSPILADDLAVNAEKASGFHASRELPVLWAITKGSLLNKIIILPIVFILSTFFPWIIAPILILGGLYLAYEGAEKIYEFIEEKLFHKTHKEVKKQLTEKEKIKSAIITDFILSIEIIVIALGTVMTQALLTQIITVTVVAVLATIGVYGVVALLVRMDDIGMYLIARSTPTSYQRKFGETLVAALPKVVKFLAVIGTLAMLLVAGGILVHNIELFHHFYESYFHIFPSIVFDFFLGLVSGAIILGIISTLLKLKGNKE